MSVMVATPKFSHPALFTGLPTPPDTPTSPLSPLLPASPRRSTLSSPATKAATTASKTAPAVEAFPKPVVDYAMLRAHHLLALQNTIARLRWEQVSNFYIKGESAWHEHNVMIAKLERELKGIQEAQKSLDRFPNCYAPTSYPEPHGPPTKEEIEEKKRKALEKERMIDETLEEKFPFIKQLFIGPLTLQQARNARRLRDMLKEGDLEGLSLLLPSENMRLLMEKQEGKEKVGHHVGPGGKPKDPKAYEAERVAKEKAKIQAYLTANPPPPRKVKPRIGPLTLEEYQAQLPVFGPKTKGETFLPHQRAQRHTILTWLRRPWGVWDEGAAEAMDKLYDIAKASLEEEAKARKAEEEARAKKREEEVIQKKLAEVKTKLGAKSKEDK